MGKKTDVWFGIILISIAIFIIIESLAFPDFISAGKKLPGPSFFPRILSIILIVVGVYEILLTGGNEHVIKREESFAEYFEDWENQNVLIVVLSLILYIFLLKWMGFVLGTFLFSSILMVRLKTGWLRGTVFSAIVVIIIILIFEKIFRIQLPKGFFRINF